MEKVKYMLLAKEKLPKVQSVFQPNEEKLSQSVVENVSKADVQSVLCYIRCDRVNITPWYKL